MARCLDLGAELAIDHRTQDFLAEMREATGGRGADVVLDVIGAAYLEKNIEVLATNGRLVEIGLQKGRTGQINLGALLSKRLQVSGTALRSRPPAEKARIISDVLANVWPMIEDGRIRPDRARAHPAGRGGAGARAHGVGRGLRQGAADPLIARLIVRRLRVDSARAARRARRVGA